jgi:hypothetical protein
MEPPLAWTCRLEIRIASATQSRLGLVGRFAVFDGDWRSVYLFSGELLGSGMSPSQHHGRVDVLRPVGEPALA